MSKKSDLTKVMQEHGGTGELTDVIIESMEHGKDDEEKAAIGVSLMVGEPLFPGETLSNGIEGQAQALAIKTVLSHMGYTSNQLNLWKTIIRRATAETEEDWQEAHQ